MRTIERIPMPGRSPSSTYSSDGRALDGSSLSSGHKQNPPSNFTSRVTTNYSPIGNVTLVSAFLPTSLVRQWRKSRDAMIAFSATTASNSYSRTSKQLDGRVPARRLNAASMADEVEDRGRARPRILSRSKSCRTGDVHFASHDAGCHAEHTRTAPKHV
jgi:hypothetical protein